MLIYQALESNWTEPLRGRTTNERMRPGKQGWGTRLQGNENRMRGRRVIDY